MFSFLSYNSLKALFVSVVLLVGLRKCHTLYKVWFVKHRSIRGKVVLVTGATSGLGLELARCFWKHDCKLILSSRKIEELKKVKDDLLGENRENFNEPKILQLDLNDLQSIPRKAKEAIDFYGRIDILVNNAGVSFRGTILDTSLEVDKTIMTTNYFGHVSLTKQILPEMLSQKSGDIVVINSVQGKISIPFRSAYSASKHALTAFFDCLRSELEHDGINVCVINPGYINTNLSLNALTANGSKYGFNDATTSSGMDASLAAQKIVNCVITKQREVIMAPLQVKVAIILRSFLPEIYFQIMNRRAKKTSIAKGQSE